VSFKKIEASSGSNRNVRKKIPLAQRKKARRLVLQALYQWLMADTSPSEIAAQFREQNPGKIDWEYFDQVFINIPSHQKSLNQYLEPVLDRNPDALDLVERSLLYIGVFELANRVDIPYKVVINECIELAKLFGATDSHKYVNSVLDKLVKTLRPIELNARA
jgi:N utilization substance protein B